jgi:hypothetical protein
MNGNKYNEKINYGGKNEITCYRWKQHIE